MKALSQKVLKLKIERFLTRLANQDVLESYFGDSRAHRGRNTTPTPLQFQEIFRTLLIKRLSGPKIVGSNVDYVEQKNILFTIKQYLCSKTVPCIANDEENDEETEIVGQAENRLEEQRQDDEPDLKGKVLRAVNFCETCCKDMAGEQFYFSIRMAKTALQKQLNVKWHFKKLSELLLNRTSGYFEFSWNSCEKHRDKLKSVIGSYLVERVITNFCKRKNAQLKLEEIARRTQQKEKTEKVICV